MFITINKDKIVSYLISVSTVAVLFVMSIVITGKKEKEIPTSTNIINNSSNIIEKNEYN